MEAGADIGIMTDDGYSHVRMGVHANELGFPVIVLNHGVSEEWGIMNLAKYVQQLSRQLKYSIFLNTANIRLLVDIR